MIIEKTLEVGNIWLMRRFTENEAKDEFISKLIIIESEGIDFKSIKLIINQSKGIKSVHNDTKRRDSSIFYGEIRNGTNGWLPVININNIMKHQIIMHFILEEKQ